MADPAALAHSLALDVMREHLPLIERSTTAAQARAGMATTIEQARGVLIQSTGQHDTATLDRAVDELLATLVVMQRPRIDRFGRLYDAGAKGAGGRTGLVLLAVGLLVAGLVAAFLLAPGS